MSSCSIQASTIKESVAALAQAGFTNIELTGGTEYYPDYEDDLCRLTEEHGLRFLVHNYFPPPKLPFMLNLASSVDEIYRKSIELCKEAIQLSKRIDGGQYGVHAGYLIDFGPAEAGRKIGYRQLNDRRTALRRFSDAWQILTDEAGDTVSLYVENNVLSATNARIYGKDCPFLLVGSEGYLELREDVEFKLLLDLAHLKVSSKSSGWMFEDELRRLMPESDYLHLSDNDGLHDQNSGFGEGSQLLAECGRYNLKGKTITLEVYDDLCEIERSHAAVSNLRPAESLRS